MIKQLMSKLLQRILCKIASYQVQIYTKFKHVPKTLNNNESFFIIRF